MTTLLQILGGFLFAGLLSWIFYRSFTPQSGTGHTSWHRTAPWDRDDK